MTWPGIPPDPGPSGAAEAALRASEARYRRLTEFIPALLWAADLQGVMTDHNGRWYEYTGQSPAQALGDGWKEITHPGDLRRVMDRWEKCLRTGEDYSIEYRIRRASDGAYRWHSVQASLMMDEAGDPLGWYGACTDIEDRRRAEEALRRSEASYRLLFNTLIEGFCIIEVLFDADQVPIDYRFLEINPAFEAQTGLHHAQGKRILELAPANEAHWFRIYGKVALTGESIRFVNEAKALGRWYEVSAYRVGGAESRKVAILFNDITDSRRAEEALRESEARFRSLADAIPQLCWVANGDGWIIWYNRRWYEYTGTTPDQMEGWGWQSVHDPKILPQVLERWQACIANGQPFEMVFPLRGGDGRFRPFLTRGMPVLDEAGKVIRWFGTNTDITEPMRLEEERHLIEERMVQAQKLESLGVLVAGVAHNFNNILAIIMGTASIQEQEVSEPAHLEGLRIIRTACQRGRSLVQSLTHFSRPSLSHQVPVELNALVAEVRVLLENTTRNRIGVLVLPTGEPTWILGDPGSLSSVLMNICLNSLDAMPDGGTLTLRTAVPRPDWVEVAIEDTGAGMAPEILARVTEPFFTTKPVGKGTGLGLSITHGVVKAHGGTMAISSQPGQGTQVRLGLPRSPAPVPEPAVQASLPPLGP